MPKLAPSKYKFSGDLIEIRRKVLGLSKLELSRKIKVSPTTISFWEQGTFQPEPKYIPLLAKILKMNAENLYLSVK